MSTETTETTTVDKTWLKYVRAAQTALKAADKGAWALGKVAHDVTEDAQYGDGCIAKLADEVDMGASTLRAYRQTFAAYGIAERSAQNSFSIHMLFAGLDDRVGLVNSRKWTAREARAELKARKQATQDAAIPTTPEPTGNGAEGAAGAARADEGTPAPEPTYEDSTGDLIARLLGATHSDRWEAFAAVLRESMPEEITTLINRLMMAQPWPVEATPAPAKPAPRKRSRKADSLKVLSPSDADALASAAQVVNDAAERELAEAA